jgi:hypothetical protein
VAILVVAIAVLSGARSAAADSLLYRCGPNICRAGSDGTGRTKLTTDGRSGGPAYSWLSASRNGSRLAVAKGASAYVLDRSGRRITGPLQRGGAVLVAQISPDGKQIATLELLGELTPPPVGAPPGSPPTLGLHPYLFLAAATGAGRDVVARDVVDAAWTGGRLVRSDSSSAAPFGRGLCLLAVNTDFACQRDLARDPASDLSAPAVSPDGRLVALARSPVAQGAASGQIVLFNTATGQLVRALTTGSHDGLPTFSPDGRRVAFNRGNDIYVTSTTGVPGSERRVLSGAQQPVWVSGGPACRLRRSVIPTVRTRDVIVRACAPSAGRLTVTLALRGRRVARRTVFTARGGLVTIHFDRQPRGGALSATVVFRAT